MATQDPVKITLQKMMRIFKNYIIYSFLLLFSLLTSCIREDLDECFAGLRLHFEFNLHTNGGNNFGSDVQAIHVYLFDSAGILQHIEKRQGAILTNNYVMDMNIPPGKYTIIAWGGSYEDLNNSFHEGHMNDPQTHRYENGVTIGKTTLNDFRVFLNYKIADDYPEDIIPEINEFDDLYYGAVGKRERGSAKYTLEEVDVKYGELTERTIDLMCNTNILKLTITGLEYFKHQNRNAENTLNQFSVWASARNGHYTYENAIGEYDRMLRYHPYYQIEDNYTLSVNIKLMRFDMERHSAEPIYLTIEDSMTHQYFPKEPIDVVKILLQARNPQTGEYLYQSQEDFDRIYEHPIRVDISADLHVRVFVHGWEVVILSPDITVR